MPVPAGMQWTREYLRQKGIPDSEITWDPQTSAVSVYGQELKPQYGENGMSYASTANLDKFFSSLQPTFRMNQLMGQIDQLRNFQYNPQTDPAFQQAQKGITRNVMNTLQDRGLLLSTQTPERIAQATAEALPQFESAATQRNQQNLQNLFSLVQTIQQQQQAADEAKRQEQYTALNQLNTLAGLTGAIPDVGAQFGLTPGSLTASERARRETAARAAAPAAVSPQEQAVNAAWNSILQGKGTAQDWAIVGRKQPGTEFDAAAARKELNDISGIMGNRFNWSGLPKNVQDYYTNRAAELQAALAGTAEDPLVADMRAKGYSEEQIQRALELRGQQQPGGGTAAAQPSPPSAGRSRPSYWEEMLRRYQR